MGTRISLQGSHFFRFSSMDVLSASHRRVLQSLFRSRIPLENPPEEVSELRRLRGLKELCTRPALQNLPGMNECRLFTGLPRKPHFVRDDHEFNALFLKFRHDVKHLGRIFRIERARGLVKEQEPGLRRHGACNGCALLLSARKFRRQFQRMIRETKPFHF